jgi:hypothetical protein
VAIQCPNCGGYKIVENVYVVERPADHLAGSRASVERRS